MHANIFIDPPNPPKGGGGLLFIYLIMGRMSSVSTCNNFLKLGMFVLYKAFTFRLPTKQYLFSSITLAAIRRACVVFTSSVFFWC